MFVDAFARPNEKSELCIGAAGRGQATIGHSILLIQIFPSDLCQRHNVLPVAYLNMSLPRIEGTATLMTLPQLKEMFFAVRLVAY